MNDPIVGCIERWHAHLRGATGVSREEGLDELLHPDCVFLSPIVFTPQRGRDITKLYLLAAANTLAGTDGDHDTVEGSGPFHYVKEVLDGHHAVLEFETTVLVDGEPKYANGVDIITCDDDGKIVEFKVMMRPLQAINAVHEHMKAMLDRLGS